MAVSGYLGTVKEAIIIEMPLTFPRLLALLVPGLLELDVVSAAWKISVGFSSVDLSCFCLDPCKLVASPANVNLLCKKQPFLRTGAGRGEKSLLNQTTASSV